MPSIKIVADPHQLKRAENSFVEWISEIEELVPLLMEEAGERFAPLQMEVVASPNDDLFEFYELDRTNPKHWLVTLMLTDLIGRAFGLNRHSQRSRGRPKGTPKWTPRLLEKIGAVVEEYKRQDLYMSYEEIAALLRPELIDKVAGVPAVKTLSKQLPLALGVHRLMKQRKERLEERLRAASVSK
jgi:hypothetical protein